MGDLALVGANGAGEAMVAVAETPRQRCSATQNDCAIGQSTSRP